uniref:UDP-glucuronosyltransferase 2C1-like n=1 Tax=Hirondellea gigas TaxID=1518452 RepID=A0A2P2I4R3_9CRUS
MKLPLLVLLVSLLVHMSTAEVRDNKPTPEAKKASDPKAAAPSTKANQGVNVPKAAATSTKASQGVNVPKAAASSTKASQGTNVPKTAALKSAKKAKILFVAPFGSKSHKIFYDGVVEAIADDGHQVTMLTPFERKKVHKNIKDVVFEGNDIGPILPNTFEEGMMSATMTAIEKGPSFCFGALTSQETKSVLLEKYDLVFVSIFFNECFLGVVHAMKVPFVFINPAEMFGPFNARLMGNPTFPSFNYNPMLNFETPLSLYQRTLSAISEVVIDWLLRTNFNRIDVTGQSLGLFGVDTPSTADISTNASLMIVNSVRLAEHPRPYMPNILLTGCIHCRDPQPLPKELEAWVASAGEAGIIFFSLGSAIRSSLLPKEKVEAMVSVFGSLPQKVLWKHDLTKLEQTLPSNVRLTKWASQQDLLGHPRMRLFITHGGLLSTQEATYHGVPILGIPVFGDQEGNMAGAEAQGWGIKLSWDELTQQSLAAAIEHLINNPEKQRNVARIRELMKDAPLTPQQEVVWWTNYLLRTGGAPHLRSGAAGLPWYQLYNTDVWVLLTSGVLLLLWVQYWILRTICRTCYAYTRQKSDDKKKKQ